MPYHAPLRKTLWYTGIMIRTLIIVILLVIVLSLLGVDFSGVTENPTIKSNFQTLWNWVTHIFTTYIREPLITAVQKVLDWLTGSSGSAMSIELYA